MSHLVVVFWPVAYNRQLGITQISRNSAVNIGKPLIIGPVGQISPTRSFNSLTEGDFSSDRAASWGVKNSANSRKSLFGESPSQFRMSNFSESAHFALRRSRSGFGFEADGAQNGFPAERDRIFRPLQAAWSGGKSPPFKLIGRVCVCVCGGGFVSPLDPL